MDIEVVELQDLQLGVAFPEEHEEEAAVGCHNLKKIVVGAAQVLDIEINNIDLGLAIPLIINGVDQVHEPDLLEQGKLLTGCRILM